MSTCASQGILLYDAIIRVLDEKNYILSHLWGLNRWFKRLDLVIKPLLCHSYPYLWPKKEPNKKTKEFLINNILCMYGEENAVADMKYVKEKKLSYYLPRVNQILLLKHKHGKE